QKMEAVGQLTGGIAHDFNNLLTGITGSLDLIRRRLDANRTDGLDRFMDAASTSAQRAAALTHRLLAFARRQSLDTKPQDVNVLVAGLEDMLRRTLGEGVNLETVLESGLWPALTDANQLESALLNLTINARDAMPKGGQLTIETANTHLDEAYALLTEDVSPGDYVVICVSDTGSGMPAEVIAKAFDPFFTTKPVGQGTGLGLSMIYGYVKQSGGHVRIYSEVGQGTTVKLYLRRALDAEERPRDEPASDAPRGSGETVLVVEDDATVRLLVTEVLEDLGYRYLEAADARTALPLLQSERPIDLLVTDVGLPHMNGRQLAEVARQHRPDLKVLFITGYAENAAVRGGFLGPGMEMMTKPFALDALAAKIRDLIET
nr:response regulator [Hyphomicrobiales bacterium]